MLVLKMASTVPKERRATRTCQLNAELGEFSSPPQGTPCYMLPEGVFRTRRFFQEDGEAKVRSSRPQSALGQERGHLQPWRQASSTQEATPRDTGTITVVISGSQRGIWRKSGQEGHSQLVMGRPWVSCPRVLWRQLLRWLSVTLPPGTHALVQSPPLECGLDLVTSF